MITISIHRKNSLSKRGRGNRVIPYYYITNNAIGFFRLENSKFIATTNYFVYSGISVFPSSDCFTGLLYTKTEIRRAAGHFQFISNLFRRPIAGDFIECNRAIEPVPLSRMWAGVGNKDVFFFDLLYLHRDKTREKNRK